MREPENEENDVPVVVPIEDSLDLHGFAPREIQAVVEEYLFQCRSKGFRQVRIIHGRGRGIQRSLVREVLKASVFVLSFRDAGPEAGGWGATVVELISK
jgi:dsDNA-specific endonuclease/ATPase MutS2